MRAAAARVAAAGPAQRQRSLRAGTSAVAASFSPSASAAASVAAARRAVAASLSSSSSSSCSASSASSASGAAAGAVSSSQRAAAATAVPAARAAAALRAALVSRGLATSAEVAAKAENVGQRKMRNIGISAHIDSGKTTLTERVLFYTGRINQIREVRGGDGGAKMDSMDLEREKGITIQSAATHCRWGDAHVNIIDTPGHVDFTIEVERALRVLDGAVLVLCGVSGVQSQTITVDRQMRRYDVPRLAFINKLDRSGADPDKVQTQLREKLGLNAVALQVPIGLETEMKGIFDLVTMEAIYFDGDNGEDIRREKEIPELVADKVARKREELLGALADLDESGAILEKVMEGEDPDVDELKAVIRKSTIERTFVPVLVGTALKNKGVQTMLDAVVDYLPTPLEADNVALDAQKDEAPVELESDSTGDFVGLAFKLEETRFGQLTYMRVYSGTLRRGEQIVNTSTQNRLKVPRLVRMHAADMEEVEEVGAGDICAMFGVDCHSGTTFTSNALLQEKQQRLLMTSMHVPNAVMSYSISADRDADSKLSKALSKFQKEDPTFRVSQDQESAEIIISGMGELHLDIYIERLKREFGVTVTTGQPLVAYRETVQRRAEFSYQLKKQSGGRGQYAKVEGFMEPFDYVEHAKEEAEKAKAARAAGGDAASAGGKKGKAAAAAAAAAESKKGDDILSKNRFQNDIIGGSIPPNFMPAVVKGYEASLQAGPLLGQPCVGITFGVTDGAYHAVDSSEMAFKLATAAAFREGFEAAGGVILEPIMSVEVTCPEEFQGVVTGGINQRKGVINDTQTVSGYVTILCDVPLAEMFGYSTDLRSMTQGKGEFSMEHARDDPVTADVQQKLQTKFKQQAIDRAKALTV